jgi:N-sulfoglucosamine sulfohydrolase
MDGRSFLPVLRGQRQEGRDRVYTVFHETAGKQVYLMRSVQTRKYGYIFDAWSDGQTVFRNEAQGGLAFRGMTKAAESQPEVAARVRFFLYRVPEELYDYENDSCALHNLAADPEYRDELERLRGDMRKIMEATSDPLLSVFTERVTATRVTRD